MIVKPEKPQDIKPGDILLWHSKSLFPRLIQLFDGTPYNHASIVYGVIAEIGMVTHIESEKKGVDLDIVTWHHFQKPGRITVLRQTVEEGNGAWDTLGEEAAASASKYLGRMYAIHTLILLSVVLGQSRRRGKWPWWMWALYVATFALWPFKWLATRGGKHSLICSELVARAYRDVGYALVPGKDPDLVTPGDIWRANFSQNGS